MNPFGDLMKKVVSVNFRELFGQKILFARRRTDLITA